MFFAKQLIQKMLVDEKANALRVLEVLKEYPAPKVYPALYGSDIGFISGIDFVWGNSIYLSFIENRIRCVFHTANKTEEFDNIEPKGLVRILDEWQIGGSL